MSLLIRTKGLRQTAICPATALTTLEVEELVGKLQSAGWKAREAGFNGIDILAANGYLIDRFFLPS